MPSKVSEDGQRGWIIPIGGAEDKLQRRRILKRFVQLCLSLIHISEPTRRS